MTLTEVISAIALVILVAWVAKALRGDPKKPTCAEDLICPVCGYYCNGKGGRGCIDKPRMMDKV